MTKTILIITDNLPEQINGVVTTYTNIAACAILDGYHVVYLTPREFRYIDCPGYDQVKIAYPGKMGKKIKEINPDHIHIATEGPLGLSARKYFSKHRISYNTAYHTKFPEGLKALFNVPEKFTWAFVRWFHKRSNCVLTTTDTMVKELRAHKFKGNIIPWTRGVDRSVFSPNLREELPSKYLLCVSRVSKEKNLEDFFELDYPGYQKIMVGDGPMLETYKQQYPDVVFTGFKTGVDLARYYANAEVFVFPSRWETFGLVMIEAMACGTPVAAYPCQGPEDVIDQAETGFMNDSLADAVTACLQLRRDRVHTGSLRWTWEKAWTIFRDNLVEKLPKSATAFNK
jgi:glycosyltransferase involved in cell wall biosynthesis